MASRREKRSLPRRAGEAVGLLASLKGAAVGAASSQSPPTMEPPVQPERRDGGAVKCHQHRQLRLPSCGWREEFLETSVTSVVERLLLSDEALFFVNVPSYPTIQSKW